MSATVEAVEQVDSRARILANPPIVEPLDGQGCEREHSLPAEPAPGHEGCVFEHAQVLKHRCSVELGKPDAQLSRRARSLSEHIEHPSAGLRGEGFEGQAVADPDQLSKYFATGGARGRLESGTEATWDFHDFPGAFPVAVLEADPPRRIVIQWGGVETTSESGATTTTFEFEPIDGDTRTLVTITESSWKATADGAKNAFGNCEGWTGMLAALKVWIEHGINLRDDFYK